MWNSRPTLNRTISIHLLYHLYHLCPSSVLRIVFEPPVITLKTTFVLNLKLLSVLLWTMWHRFMPSVTSRYQFPQLLPPSERPKFRVEEEGGGGGVDGNTTTR